MSFKYSIIIATFNRKSELEELIASLRELDYPKSDFELIISDDGSTDGTREYIQSLSEAFAIQYLYQQNKGPGSARNKGMDAAKGDYFIFVDSDCILPRHWLSALDKDVRKYGFDAFGGPDTFDPSFPPLLKAINYSMTSFIGTGGTRGSKKSVGKFYPRSFNMGISRKVYDTVGGMNDLRHGQDMDLSARIYDAGFKVGLVTDAYVYHKRRTSLKKFYRQIFNWGVARVNLGLLHPKLLKLVHFLPMFVVLGLLVVLCLAIFAKFYWLLFVTLAGFILVCLWAFFESFFLYKDWLTASLSVVTLLIQVFAYGLGMLWAWPQALLGREAKGYVRKYYGKKITESR